MIQTVIDSSKLKDAKAAKEVISSILDIIEYAKVSEPFLWLMYILCEYARERVLAESLIHIEPLEGVDSIVHGTWLSDIDPRRGRVILLDAIKSMPTAFFLRMCLSTHLVARAFWNHSRREDQLSLIELADEALKKVGVKNDQKRLKALLSDERKED
jgi:hypothetical protein